MKKQLDKTTECGTLYTLIVPEGMYSEDSIIKLLWVVFSHRFSHFLKGEGFRD